MAIQSTKGRAGGASEPTPLPAAPFNQPPISLAEIRQLIALMGATDFVEITIEREEEHLRLSLRRTTTVASAPTVAAPPTALPLATAPVSAGAPPAVDDRIFITSPLVGLYYPALRTGQKPLVAVGDTIREGQVIAGIETLRVMNEVEATASGTVVEMLAQPGQAVEYGQPLLALLPTTELRA